MGFIRMASRSRIVKGGFIWREELRRESCGRFTMPMMGTWNIELNRVAGEAQRGQCHGGRRKRKKTVLRSGMFSENLLQLESC